MMQRPSADVFVLPADRPWTIDDLERLPDDGNRYEIANGSLLVTPPPSADHGFTTHLLMEALIAQMPDGYKALTVGLGVHLPGSVYIPDLMVTTVER